MIVLSDTWARSLVAQGEAGIGYQIATIILKDGRRFEQAVIVEGAITQIKDVEGIPFSEDQIDQIVVTHDKWDFNAERKER
jgi:hypothetical protein